TRDVGHEPGKASRPMLWEPSPRAREYQERLQAFMDEFIYPNERVHRDQVRADRWQPPAIVEELKARARAAGLWNRFLRPGEDEKEGPIYGAGLSNLEYAPLCEIMGRVPWSAEVFNCSAPDTGNMEVLVRYGTREQRQRWLWPMLAGEIRSCFAMT